MLTLKFGLSTGVVLLGLLAVQAAAGFAQQNSGDLAARRIFGERVAEYAALHQRLEEPLPPLEPSTSIEPILARNAQLASAIKTARQEVRQGDIFTPAVTDLFRRTIAEALGAVDSEALLRRLYADHPSRQSFDPHVNEQYPSWATHEMPIVLLEHLPRLPGVLRYRLIDHDLVLWDMDADLIVDFVPDAIRRPLDE